MAQRMKAKIKRGMIRDGAKEKGGAGAPEETQTRSMYLSISAFKEARGPKVRKRIRVLRV